MSTYYQHDADGYYLYPVSDYGSTQPHNSLPDAPPIKPGKWARAVNGKWIQVENHTGESGYINGQPHTITEYGPYPDGWSATRPLPTLAEAQNSKRASISAGFDAAMSASLTMPSVGTPPSSFEVASALYDWRTDDPEGYASLLAIHTARRTALLAAVDAAETAEAVQAVVVSYAV